MSAPFILSPRALRATWIAWGAILLLGCAVVVSHPDHDQANDAYARGASHWLAGQDLYFEGGTGFIYLPPSAVLYVPFTVLPKPIEHILWRVLTIGLFATGTFRLCRLAEEKCGLEFFPVVSLLLLPKMWACVIHGQATAAMAGVSMLALGEIFRRRWGAAAVFLSAAVAFKPLAVVLVLLAAVIFRPLTGRLALGIAVVFGVPYLTQYPVYVSAQYLASIDMLGKAARIGESPEWPHLFSLLNLSLGRAEIFGPWRDALRAVAALATLALTWRVCRDSGLRQAFARFRQETQKNRLAGCDSEANIDRPSSAARSLLNLYALATVYLLLFNPRTENNSYLILSPVMAVFFARASFIDGNMLKAALLFAGTILIFSGHEICGALTPHAGFVWISPLVCLLFGIDLVRGMLWPEGILRPDGIAGRSIPRRRLVRR